MIKNAKNQNQIVAQVQDALQLLKTPGVNLEYLRELRERMVTSGGPHWSVVESQKYDAILAAIEILTNPVFIQ